MRSWCRDCERAKVTAHVAKVRHTPKYRADVKRWNASTYRRHPERQRARNFLNRAIKAGRLVRPSSLACTDCGTPASQYDHHRGYAMANALDVQPVCTGCNGKRSRLRGEKQKK